MTTVDRVNRLVLFYITLMGITTSLFLASAGAVFLRRFESSQLPYAFVLGGIALLLTQAMYENLKQYLAPSALLIGSLGLLIPLTIGLQLILEKEAWSWIPFALMVWLRVVLLVLGFGGSSLAKRLYKHDQQTKFTEIQALGELVGGILGAIAVLLIVRVAGADDLLWGAIGTLSLCVIVIQVLLYQAHEQLTSTNTLPTASSQPLQLGQYPYVQLLLGMLLLGTMFTYGIELAYFDRLQDYYQLEINQITAQARFDFNAPSVNIAYFIGVFLGFLQVAKYILKTYFSDLLVVRYGLRATLLLLPLLALLGMIISTGLGETESLFWLVIATAFITAALQAVTGESALRLLMQPLPSAQALLVTQLRSWMLPLGLTLVGGLLSVVTQLEQYSIGKVTALLVLVAGLWLVAAWEVYRRYTALIEKAIQRRTLAPGQTHNDPNTRAILKGRLKSQHPGEVIYALDTLKQLEGSSANNYLSDLITHPSPDVRREALLRIEQNHHQVDPKLVYILAEADDDPTVREIALRVYAGLASVGDVVNHLTPFLEDKSSPVRRGAMVGLLTHGGTVGMEAAEKQLLALTESPTPAEREFAAQVLGNVDNKRFSSYLLRLLNDDIPLVARAAILSAAKLNNPQYWSLVVPKLGEKDLASAVSTAIFIANKSIYPTLEATFNQPLPNRDIMFRIARVCGRRRDAQAIELLLSQFNFPDKVVRQQVWLSLHQCQYRVRNEAESLRVQVALREEVAEAVWLLAAQRDLAESAGAEAVSRALEAAFSALQGQLFTLLSFLYAAQPLDNIQHNLARPAKRALALDALNQLLSPSLRQTILPLVGDLTLDQRLSRLKNEFPQAALSPQERLLAILDEPLTRLNTWIRATALHALPSVVTGEPPRFALMPLLDSFEPLLRETATWTLYQLDAEDFKTHLAPQLENARSPIPRLVRELLEGNKQMLLTIEKVLILKSVGIFARIPDHILVEVAALLEELRLPTGEELFHEGDPGTSMFIIVQGSIRIYTESKVIAERHDREFIGEMSLFDAEPRSASARALADTLLLKLDQDAFTELMANHPEMSAGVIRVLSQRLREAMHQKGISPIMADIYDRIEGIPNDAHKKLELPA